MLTSDRNSKNKSAKRSRKPLKAKDPHPDKKQQSLTKTNTRRGIQRRLYPPQSHTPRINRSFDKKNMISLENSRKKLISPIDQRLKTLHDYNQSVRKKNKSSLSHQSSHKNLLQPRLPWGVDQKKMTRYVIDTLTKMQNLRQAHRHKNNIQSKQKQLNRPKLTQADSTPLKFLEQKHESDEVTQKKEIEKNKKLIFDGKDGKEKNHRKILLSGLLGQFQTIEKNNFMQVNYRVLKNKIIELQIVILKKIEALEVFLNKQSLQCQSIKEIYQNLSPKTSIFLMIAVQGCKKDLEYMFPQMCVSIHEKNGTFNVQKNIQIPYSWLYLIEPLSQESIKSSRTGSPKKIKNKAIIEGIPHQPKFIEFLLKLFNKKYLKIRKHKSIMYCFSFKLVGSFIHLRAIIFENKLSIQCETSTEISPIIILKTFKDILQI